MRSAIRYGTLAATAIGLIGLSPFEAAGEPARAKIALAEAKASAPVEAKSATPAESKPTSRTFTLDVRPGDAKTIRTIEVVTQADPKDPEVAKKVDLRIGRPGKAPDQTLSFSVDEGVDLVLQSADDVDINFDGFRDFWVLRQIGAKYARYEAFVFDPKTQRFVKDAVAREVSELDNPEVDGASKRIVTTTLGPAEPSRTVRKMIGGRLVVTDSCVFQNGHDTDGDGRNDGLLVVKKLVQGMLKVVSQKQLSVSPGDDPCAL